MVNNKKKLLAYALDLTAGYGAIVIQSFIFFPEIKLGEI